MMKQVFSTLLLMVTIVPAVALATTRNIAPQARVSASSVLDEQHAAAYATDGRIRIPGQGEWRSGVKMTFWGEIDFPWIQLDWDEEVEIQSVALYDIASSDATCAGGELVFSDGSRLLVREVPSNGAPLTVSFSPRRTRSLRFELTDGDGDYIGLSEIEVFERFDAATNTMRSLPGRYQLFYGTSSADAALQTITYIHE